MSRRPARRADAPTRTAVIQYLGPQIPKRRADMVNPEPNPTDPGRVFTDFPRYWEISVVSSAMGDYRPVLALLQARLLNKEFKAQAEHLLDKNNVEWKYLIGLLQDLSPGVRCLSVRVEYM